MADAHPFSRARLLLIPRYEYELTVRSTRPLSTHAHADDTPCASAPIEREEIGQWCFSHTQRL